MKKMSFLRAPTDPKDIFGWVIRHLVLSLGSGAALGFVALMVVALSLFGFLIGDYQNNGAGTVHDGNVTLDSATAAQNAALKLTYDQEANSWQKGLSQSQIDQVEQEQVDLPGAVLMAVGKMINNMNPTNEKLYYQYLQPQYTWQTFENETITSRKVTNPKTGKSRCVQSVTYTSVTMLVSADTWDGTLTNTYHWVTSGSLGCPGVWTKQIALASSKRTYDWSRVWNLFAHVPTEDGKTLKNTAGNRDTLAGLIGAVDYSITDPYVQRMVSSVLFPGGVQTSGIPYVSTALPSGDAIQNILHYKADIEAAAKMFDIPAVLIAGVMYQESHGNQLDEYGHVLTSSTGALGLMQVEPSTAAGLTVNGVPVGSNAYADLSNPSMNILLGAEYLSELYHEFGNNVAETLSAYNAGPGAEQEAIAEGYQIAQNEQTLQYVANIQGSWIPALEPYFGTLG
ncbi:MAG: transglycosylase SLT domain-containing protein [Alicyclobacillus sp.]|nr:transglycosylase SLT domain-containing protein [Alicyclobacillus sp.]